MSNDRAGINFTVAINSQVPAGLYYVFVDGPLAKAVAEVAQKIGNEEAYFCNLDCGKGRGGMERVHSWRNSFAAAEALQHLDLNFNCIHFDGNGGRGHALLVGPIDNTPITLEKTVERVNSTMEPLGLMRSFYVQGFAPGV